ncbi:glycosyltransferase [Latilactobacillus curvatus]|uniref:glycosyltransferase n=1 Tax=Latilactobacillus curvatus TaxID=28038 RepID=UPI0007E954B7|nr:glycosyltransferase [Latilactobacillus curvatus]ANJ69834.1 hypothetical protein FBA2_07560 [Latilactobacillus curvatus]
MKSKHDSLNVLFIISSLKRSGPVNVLYSIVMNFKKNEFTPIIVTLKPENAQSMKKDFLDLNIDVINVNRRLNSVKKIEKIIKDYKIDVVHSHGVIPDLLNVLLIKNTKLEHVTTLHNDPYEDYPLAYGRVKGKVLAQIHVKIVRKLNCIACSNTIHGRFLSYGIKSYVIQNGVNFKHPLATKTSNENIFIYVGEINERKNVNYILSSFKEESNNKLLVVGDGPKLNTLKKQYSSQSNIVFIGRVSNPGEYLQRSDCYVSASTSEGLPMAVLEAISYGLPVFLSDIDSHKEIIDNNNFIGSLFAFDTNKLSHLFNRPLILYDKNRIYNYGLKNFNIENISYKYHKVYLDLNNGSCPS